jgi:alkanesulfonate monooxygenase SsuD/methylene tetrahydromethanopterin reductase-like flavin-dependent oxidoreductase (luciferase family)
MKFGVLYDFRNAGQAAFFQPWQNFYDGAFEHMEEMERLGFHALSFAEHHGDPDGYNPGIAVTMTAAAMRTKRVRIQSNIIQLPYYHPVLLAEQLAVLDIISGGRIDAGFGQAGQTFDMEFSMLGINPKFRPSLFEEGLEIIRRAWTEDEPFNFDGKRYSLKGVWLNPKPLQKPHPAMYVVAPFSVPAAMDRVARLGLDVGAIGGFFTGLTGGEMWNQWWSAWQASCARNKRDENYARIWTFGSSYVTDDPEKAWAEHRLGVLHSFNYERQGVRPYSTMFMQTEPQTPEDVPGWEKIFVTPDQAIDELRSVYANAAPDEIHLMATKAGMSWDQSAEYMQNFIDHVMPAVRTLGAERKSASCA